jgi:hypothetical protein
LDTGSLYKHSLIVNSKRISFLIQSKYMLFRFY